MRSRRIRTRITASRPLATSAAAIAALGCTGLTLGMQDADNGGQSPLERLSDRLDTLERDNDLLRDEVKILRAQTNQEWLTEERSMELRSLVNDILADSATRTNLQESAATAGWDAERGFYLRSADNRFMLQISGLVQARYIWSHTSGAGYIRATSRGEGAKLPNNAYGFDMPHTRLVFKGHVFEPGIRFYLRTQFNPVGTFQPGTRVQNRGSDGVLDLLDAYISFDFDNEWSFRVGQFKLPFARESLVSVQNLLTADRSSVDTLMGVGRSQGMELSLQANTISWAVAISDGGTDNLLAGDSNNSGYFPAGTEPMNSPYWDHQANFAITTRFEYKLAGDWAEFQEMTSPIGEQNGILLGVAGHYQIGGAPSDLTFGSNPFFPSGGVFASTGSNNQWMSVTADLSMNFGGASVYAAAYYTNTETKWSVNLPNAQASYRPAVLGTTNLFGLVVQGSMYMAPKWELFGRYQYIDPITRPAINAYDNMPPVEFSPLSIATIGANWYIDGQDLRWNFQLSYAFNEVTTVSATPENGFRPLYNATNELVLMTQLQLQF